MKEIDPLTKSIIDGAEKTYTWKSKGLIIKAYIIPRSVIDPDQNGGPCAILITKRIEKMKNIIYKRLFDPAFGRIDAVATEEISMILGGWNVPHGIKKDAVDLGMIICDNSWDFHYSPGGQGNVYERQWAITENGRLIGGMRDKKNAMLVSAAQKMLDFIKYIVSELGHGTSGTEALKKEAEDFLKQNMLD